MDVTTFVEQYKGVRRTVLAFALLWNCVVIVGGVYKALFGNGLNGFDVAFFGTVTAMMQVPFGFYFWMRRDS